MSPTAERDWRPHADDIVEACRKIRLYMAGMTYDAFLADERTRDAVIWSIEAIGEAARKLPREVTERSLQIQWRLGAPGAADPGEGMSRLCCCTPSPPVVMFSWCPAA